MRIALYAFDVGPGKMLSHIAECAKTLGHDVLHFPSQKRINLNPELSNAVYWLMRSDILILGGVDVMYTKDQVELVKLFKQMHKPVVVVEDTPGSSSVPDFKNIALEVDVLLKALSQEEYTNKAHKFGYSRVMYFGPPPHWGPHYNRLVIAKNRRKDLVKTFHNGTREAFTKNDFFVACVGVKNSTVNNSILTDVVRTRIPGMVLGFRPHPGTSSEENAKCVWDNQRGSHSKVFENCWTVDWRELEMFSLEEFIRTADIPICIPFSTNTITAAYARIPFICYEDKNVWQHANSELDLEKNEWFVSELGGAYVADDKNIGDVMRLLLTEEGKDALISKQKENFPLPNDWDTSPKIVKFLESLI